MTESQFKAMHAMASPDLKLKMENDLARLNGQSPPNPNAYDPNYKDRDEVLRGMFESDPRMRGIFDTMFGGKKGW
jgi:hypothetical protein